LPETTDLIVDPSGIVVRRGEYAVLTRQEHAIFTALHAASPRIRTKEQLLADVYWSENDDPEIKIIDVWICKLRKKLQPLGVNIQTVWGQGYRLMPVASEREAA